ncbi:MAG: uracil-DNA glycosylase [Treponema sp.]|nr:uracil-DNA glycosylase [Treponema sp.]
MTQTEKKDIYNLLKKTASCVLGYTPQEYCNGEPDFQDDIFESPVKAETTVAESAVVQSEVEVKEQSAGGISLESIERKIAKCKNCVLGNTRINPVPGEGVQNPYVLVVGEGPGEDEDLSGRPFVGKAGQLLDKMLAAISLDRKCNCYIANIVKCRPPKNRTPMPQEADSCSGFLQAQIHILKPKAILAMGRTAVQNLMKTEQGINSLRGKILDFNGIPLLATYHPSALLRDQSLKRPAWEDLKVFRTKLEEICPEYSKSFDEARKEN